MADTTVDATVQSNSDYRGIRLGPVWVDESTAYVFYIDSAIDLVYQKTTNGGANWGTPVVVLAGMVVKLSIWYDKWTPGDTGTKIHIAYIELGGSDVFYRALDTADDSLGTQATVFAGSTFSTGAWSIDVVEITKARGGNLYIGFWGDEFGEFGFYRSTNSGVDWSSRAQLADGNSADGILLMPGDEADNQDIWCIYWDRSAEELSLKIYDDSGNSWSETSIAGGMIDASYYYQMSAAPRHSDNHVILAAWSALDTATADLRVWDIGGSGSITAKTDVVTDLAESAQVAMLVNQQNDDIYVAYLKGGTWESTVDVKYKKSTNGGGAWGAEQTYSEAAAADLRGVWAGISVGDDGGKFQPAFFNDDLDDLFVNTVNAVSIAEAAVGETRSLAGDQPAATGTLARIEQGIRALVGDQPSASGILTHDAVPARAMAGNQPAPSGILIRVEQALRAPAGNQPAATGILTRVLERPRSLAGSQPAATGTLTAVKHSARAVSGSQPAPTGILTRVEQASRALTGAQLAPTGTLARVEQAIRALAGSQPSAVGTLSGVLKVMRSLAGNQPAAAGALARIEHAKRALTGSQPSPTGALTRKEQALRALSGSQPAASGTLTRSKAFFALLVGDQPAALGIVVVVIVEPVTVVGPPLVVGFGRVDIDIGVRGRGVVSVVPEGHAARMDLMPLAFGFDNGFSGGFGY